MRPQRTKDQAGSEQRQPLPCSDSDLTPQSRKAAYPRSGNLIKIQILWRSLSLFSGYCQEDAEQGTNSPIIQNPGTNFNLSLSFRSSISGSCVINPNAFPGQAPSCGDTELRPAMREGDAGAALGAAVTAKHGLHAPTGLLLPLFTSYTNSLVGTTADESLNNLSNISNNTLRVRDCILCLSSSM